MQTINRAKIPSSLQNPKIGDEKGENYNTETVVVRSHDGVKKTNSEEVIAMPPALSHGNENILREGASFRCFSSRTQGLAHHQRAPATDLAHTSLLKQIQEVQ